MKTRTEVERLKRDWLIEGRSWSIWAQAGFEDYSVELYNFQCEVERSDFTPAGGSSVDLAQTVLSRISTNSKRLFPKAAA